MKLTCVWLVKGVFDGRTEVVARVVADTFEEATRLAAQALQYTWVQYTVSEREAPPVAINSVTLVYEEVRLGE